MFLVFMAVGLVLGVVHNLVPGPHHLRFSAVLISGMGAWFGGFVAAALVQGTFATMGTWWTVLGSAVGALAHLWGLELILDRLLHSSFETDPGW